MKTCIKLSGKARKITVFDLPNVYRHSLVREAFDPKLMNQIVEMLCEVERVNLFIQSANET